MRHMRKSKGKLFLCDGLIALVILAKVSYNINVAHGSTRRVDLSSGASIGRVRIPVHAACVAP